MSRNLRSRVRKIERNVLQPIEPGSTKISVVDLPEAEQELFQKTQEITDYYKPEEITEEQLFLIKQANKRIFFRTVDLFKTSLGAWFRTKEDTTKNYLLHLRLWYFLFELGRHMEQVDVENLLIEKHKKYEDFRKAFEEWRSKQKNQTPLWTRESFSHWFNDLVLRGYEKRRIKEKKVET